MALRSEKRLGAVLIMTAVMACAQPFTYQVRLKHLHGGETGTLTVSADSIVFPAHSLQWKYADIEQLSLSATELRILTYEDRKWQLGRDREYVFDRLPEGLAHQLYPLFASTLDQRFVAALPDTDVHALWRMAAKLGRTQGGLIVAEDRIVYQTSASGESRTWRFADIDSVSTGGLFDLSITTLERSGWWHAGPTEFHFELKEALQEDRYNELWRRINRSHILAQK